jgi:hypothetical protein
MQAVKAGGAAFVKCDRGEAACVKARGGYSREVVGSRVVRDEKGNAVRVHARCRGCPRNCERRASLHLPLELSLREGRGEARTRKPGDLPAASTLARALGWRARRGIA